MRLIMSIILFSLVTVFPVSAQDNTFDPAQLTQRTVFGGVYHDAAVALDGSALAIGWGAGLLRYPLDGAVIGEQQVIYDDAPVPALMWASSGDTLLFIADTEPPTLWRYDNRAEMLDAEPLQTVMLDNRDFTTVLADLAPGYIDPAPSARPKVYALDIIDGVPTLSHDEQQIAVFDFFAPSLATSAITPLGWVDADTIFTNGSLYSNCASTEHDIVTGRMVSYEAACGSAGFFATSPDDRFAVTFAAPPGEDNRVLALVRLGDDGSTFLAEIPVSEREGDLGLVDVLWTADSQQFLVVPLASAARLFSLNERADAVTVDLAHEYTPPAAPDGATPAPVSIAFTPDEAFIALGYDDGTVSVYALDSADPRLELAHERPQQIAWSPDGTRLATGGTDGVMRIYGTGE